jgi:hypothetical protein
MSILINAITFALFIHQDALRHWLIFGGDFVVLVTAPFLLSSVQLGFMGWHSCLWVCVSHYELFHLSMGYMSRSIFCCFKQRVVISPEGKELHFLCQGIQSIFSPGTEIDQRLWKILSFFTDFKLPYSKGFFFF